ncbi:FAD binding domain-containing protein [Paraburkholderia phymatum]|uniref:Monooxygenase FAD-binding n=1 Tax=Paraburkholderia phymatum (strain DSM 17167 / CIP 108236 / LMG 21445 / STM815) TaxID=391038 RepID=B2JV00_PARP8|nr:FAD binding domain-containing protein [Paraburkholderia phymatum]ACC74778.1 monooxygenase FAD-binding [Paraburkholderia phymatum STM815]
MKHQPLPRAVVIGGSLGGLFAATSLRAAGWHVEVFESSPNQLDTRGGGIVLQPDVLQAARYAGAALPSPAGVRSGERIYLDRGDNIVERLDMPQTQTAWSLLYRAMKDALPAQSLHAGETFVDFEQDGDEVVARFESGRAERGDLLIGADGIRSTLRQRLLPDVTPAYAGYVAWRGLVPEQALPAPAADMLRERFAFQHGDGHSALAYLIPGERDETRVGERRWNWVWYRRYSEDVLTRLLVDRYGMARTGSLPPGMMKQADIDRLRNDAQAELGPTFRALVDSTADPFMQPIVDLRAPRMVFGRALLIGDAAAVPRPHTAGSTAKAAANAHSLALALDLANGSGLSIDERLARWEALQVQRSKQMTDLGISLGKRLMTVAPPLSQRFSAASGISIQTPIR